MAGCASLDGGGPPPASDLAGARPIFGEWIARDGFLTANARLPEAAVGAYTGTPVAIGADRVVGVRGNRCDAPVFASGVFSKREVASEYGIPARHVAQAGERLSVVTVTCGDRPFDVFIRLDEDRLLTGFNGAFFSLVPASETEAPDEPIAAAGRSGSDDRLPPVPVLPPEVAAWAEPRPAASAGETIPAAAAPAVRRTLPEDHGIHLASYRRQASAERGWRVLSARHPELGQMEPVVVDADLGARGVFKRLLATGGSAEAVEALCARLAAEGEPCRVLPVNSDRQTAMLPARSGPAVASALEEGEREPASGAAKPAPPRAAAGGAASAPSDAPRDAARPGAARMIPASAPARSGLAAVDRDELIGTWRIGAGVPGCAVANTIAFFPEGSARVYQDLEGEWTLEAGRVVLDLMRFGDDGRIDQAGIPMRLDLLSVEADRFEAELLDRDKETRVAARRCS